MGGLDRVADVLAVGEAGMAEKLAARGDDCAGIAAVGAGLLAADVELGGAVEGFDGELLRFGQGFRAG